MAIFKHKDGGICEVLTNQNIVRLRKNPNYKEVLDKKDNTNQKNKSGGNKPSKNALSEQCNTIPLDVK